MSILTTLTKKKFAAAVATASVLAGGGTAAAFAATGTGAASATGSAGGSPGAVTSVRLAATSSPTAGSAAKAASLRRPCRHPKGLLGRTDYATVEVKRHKQWVTLTLERGKVKAVSANSITLLRPDGKSATIALGAHTHYRGVASSASTVKVNRRATVMSENGTALAVSEPWAPHSRKAAPSARSGSATAASKSAASSASTTAAG